MTLEFVERPTNFVVYVAAALIVLLPVLLFPIPPLLDYPNHLARLWLIEGGATIAPLNHFYAISWQGIATNIGIDVAAEISKGVIPPFVLGRILVAIAIVLPPLGTLALNSSEFRGVHPGQILFFYFAFALTLLAGFLNFQIGLGLALFCAAADERLAERGHTIHTFGRLGFGITIMLIHPFALLFYSALLSGLGFGRDAIEFDAKSLRRRVLHAAPAVLVTLVPISLLLLWTRTIPGAQNTGDVLYNNAFEAIAALDSPLFSYNVNIDGLFALSIILLVFYAAKKRSIEVHSGLLLAAGALAFFALFVPRATPQSGWLDVRMPIMAMLAGLAATRISFGGSNRRGWTLAAVALSILSLRTAWICWNWSASESMLDTMHAVLADVPAGAAVLPMQHTLTDSAMRSSERGRVLENVNETYRHFPALMVPWRHAFYPTLFSVAGAHPAKILPPWDAISDSRGGVLPSVNALRFANLQTAYMADWRTRFDFVLVLNADRPDRYGTFIPPPELKLIADAGFAELFQIRHGKSRTNVRLPQASNAKKST